MCNYCPFAPTNVNIKPTPLIWSMLHTVVLLHNTVKTVTRWHLDSLKGKVNIMLQNISISNKGCSFEISVHQRILNIYSAATVFNIDKNQKSFLSSKLLFQMNPNFWPLVYRRKNPNQSIDALRFSLQQFRIDSELSFNQMCDDAEFALETPVFCLLPISHTHINHSNLL